MSDQRQGINARESHIWSLRMAILVLFLICVGLITAIVLRQNEFTMQIPPDISQGALVRPGEYFEPNAYVFALHVWREINHWPKSGSREYLALINEHKCVVTPAFLQWLRNNVTEKERQGELDRSRTLVPIGAYQKSLVRPLGGNTFAVYLNVSIEEAIRGRPLRTVAIHYPMRVVPDHRSCNPFGMALDGFDSAPQRITEESK